MTEKKEVTEKKEMTSQEIQQLMDQDQRTRMKTCQNEIEVILKKYACELIALPGINLEGRIIAEVQIKIVR